MILIFNISKAVVILRVQILYINLGDLYKMINNVDEFRELVSLVEKFIEVADKLKEQGRIDEEQYIHMTKNKIKFLEEARENKK